MKMNSTPTSLNEVKTYSFWWNIIALNLIIASIKLFKAFLENPFCAFLDINAIHETVFALCRFLNNSQALSIIYSFKSFIGILYITKLSIHVYQIIYHKNIQVKTIYYFSMDVKTLLKIHWVCIHGKDIGKGEFIEMDTTLIFLYLVK